ncbi:MAG: HugZ family protein [Thiobacillaceae bacterium]
MSDLGTEARRFVRAHPHGVLATLSKRLDGYPFGSVAPFVTDQTGAPIILISTLAEHTKNIAADARVSLIVHPCAQDMQTAGRVTITGQAIRLPDKASLRPRYLRYLPAAEQYFDMHDFNFYRIEPAAIRFIGGFGKIHWIEPGHFAASSNQLADIESGILQHMNSDHADALMALCRHFHGVATEQADMIGIDCDGFDVRANGQNLRIEFTDPVLDAASARAALVKLAHEARA